jgi:hypothetical protein
VSTYANQLFRVGNRQLPECQGVQKGKDGGVRADSQSKRQYRHSSNRSILDERSYAETEILDRSFEKDQNVDLSRALFKKSCVSETALCIEMRFPRRHANSDVCLFSHLDVEPQFLFDIRFESRRSEKSTKSISKSHGRSPT